MNERLILIAHGSRRERWRAAIEALAAKVQAGLGHPVGLAYMELCEPTLDAVADAAVAEGAAHVRVLPLFWSGGGHVERDISAQVKRLRERWPGVSFTLEPALGEHPAMAAAICAIAAE